MRNLIIATFLVLTCAPALATELPPSTYYRGELALPDGNRLPMELEFFVDAAGQVSANVASPAEGSRYVSVSKVQWQSDELFVHTVAPDAAISGSIDDDGNWNARFVQGEFGAELPLKPSAGMTEIPRAQSVQALVQWPGVEVSIPSAAAALGGSYVAPPNAAAAVLILAGSGRAQRDGYHAGHRPLAVLAAALAEAKIASLRYDKRGVYRSSGSLDVTDLQTIVADASAALAKLRELQPELPILVIGHSEGGVVAAMLAAKDGQLAGVISLMGPTLPISELFALQDGTEALAEGASTEQAATLQDFTRRIYQTAANHSDPQQRMAALGAIMEAANEAERTAFEKYNGGTGTLSGSMLRAPHYDQLLAVEPMRAWASSLVPSLLIFGEHDAQVPAAENAKPVKLHSGLDVVVVQGVNHVLQTSTVAAPSKYAQIDNTVDPGLLKTVIDWINQRTR